VNCYSTGSVYGDDSLGGLVGRNFNGTVVNSHSAASVKGLHGNVGGLVGDNVSTIITSHSTGSVSSGDHVGGLVGYNEGTISNSYSTADVKWGEDIGGLVGSNWGTVLNCFSNSSVVSNESNWNVRSGGLVGFNTGTVSNSFWDLSASGKTKSAGGLGLTIAQMKDQNTFTGAGWDFRGESENGTNEIWETPVDGNCPMLAVLSGSVPPEPTTGDGRPGNPYLIETAQDLGAMWYRPMASYQLVKDIDLSGIRWTGAVMALFGGRFDGQNHRISNICITGGDSLGLFGLVFGQGVISNLGLENVKIVSTGSCVGGMAGESRGTITNSCSRGSVSTREGYNVGGLVGLNNGGCVLKCCSTGSAQGSGLRSYRGGVGGLMGYNIYGIVSNSYSTSSVSGDDHVGGLIGRNNGLIGDTYQGEVTNCYSTGSVDTKDVFEGGLIGESVGKVRGCFWDIETVGPQDYMPIIERCGIGKKTSEMKAAGTFLNAGWDFVGETENGSENIWWIDEGKDYPHLSWEIPGDPNTTVGK
jgi:hypothetical protein